MKSFKQVFIFLKLRVHGNNFVIQTQFHSKKKEKSLSALLEVCAIWKLRCHVEIVRYVAHFPPSIMNPKRNCFPSGEQDENENNGVHSGLVFFFLHFTDEVKPSSSSIVQANLFSL